MIDKAKNRDMASAENKSNKSELSDFFFAGGMEYKPMTVRAGSIEEAEEYYHKNKIKN